MDDFKVTVTYKGKTFDFEYGSQVYIFHTGVYKDMDTKYGLEVLLEYVQFVQACYLADSNRTPLGALADYIADKWKRVKKMGRYDLLEKFYMEEYY